MTLELANEKKRIQVPLASKASMAFRALMVTLALGFTHHVPSVSAATPYPSRVSLSDAMVDPSAAGEALSNEKAAIHETLARLDLALDSRNVSALRQLVTTDVRVHHALYGSTVGSAAFVHSVIDYPGAFDRYRHVAMNTVSTVLDPNTAEALSYILVLQVFSDDAQANGGHPLIAGVGVVRDALVKEKGRWRIRHRVYDQFGLNPALFPDEALRLHAAGSLNFSGNF